jgi:hypothetical protein
MIPATTTQEDQSQNSVKQAEQKQGFLSYLSASKGFLASSLGYFTLLTKILPAFAQNSEACIPNQFIGTWVTNTCYEFYPTGVVQVNGTNSFCNVDPKTLTVFEELIQRLYYDNECGPVIDCTTPYPTFIKEIANITIYRSFDGQSFPHYEECVQKLIRNISNPNDNEGISNGAIIVYAALAIAGTFAVGTGLYYAKKFVNSWLEQRQQTGQGHEGTNEGTHLFNQL